MFFGINGIEDFGSGLTAKHLRLNSKGASFFIFPVNKTLTYLNLKNC
jgi:hypothetical protein